MIKKYSYDKDRSFYIKTNCEELGHTANSPHIDYLEISKEKWVGLVEDNKAKIIALNTIEMKVLGQSLSQKAKSLFEDLFYPRVYFSKVEDKI